MRGIPDIMVCRILVFMWSLGALDKAVGEVRTRGGFRRYLKLQSTPLFFETRPSVLGTLEDQALLR